MKKQWESPTYYVVSILLLPLALVLNGLRLFEYWQSVREQKRSKTQNQEPRAETGIDRGLSTIGEIVGHPNLASNGSVMQTIEPSEVPYTLNSAIKNVDDKTGALIAIPDPIALTKINREDQRTGSAEIAPVNVVVNAVPESVGAVIVPRVKRRP